jgi:hypothetical protein
LDGLAQKRYVGFRVPSGVVLLTISQGIFDEGQIGLVELGGNRQLHQNACKSQSKSTARSGSYHGQTKRDEQAVRERDGHAIDVG